MANEAKGRCWDCHVVFYWSGRPLVRDAGCPRCGKRLARTTYCTRDPKVYDERPAMLGAVGPTEATQERAADLVERRSAGSPATEE